MTLSFSLILIDCPLYLQDPVASEMGYRNPYVSLLYCWFHLVFEHEGLQVSLDGHHGPVIVSDFNLFSIIFAGPCGMFSDLIVD